MEIKIAELYFKCKYCGRVGQIYPMHYCSAIKGMRDIEGVLAESTIELSDEEKEHHGIKIQKSIWKRLKSWL